MATATAQIAVSCQETLQRVARLLPLASPPTVLLSIPFLPLDLQKCDVADKLLRMKCSPAIVDALQRLHAAGQSNLERPSRSAYERTMGELAQACGDDHSLLSRYQRALKHRYEAEFYSASSRLRQRLLEIVQAAQERVAAVHKRGPFSDEVVAVLERAFAIQDTLNRTERKQLSEATGLGEKQVATWFANKRQRRESKLQRERAAPYDSSLRPKGRRDFSGSSSSSLSSLESAYSDVSTAPSSIESWISSSASSSYESESSFSPTRETSPSSTYPYDLQVSSDPLPPLPHPQYILPQEGYRVASAFGPPPSWPSAPTSLPSFSTTLPTPTPTRSSFPSRPSGPAQSSSIHPFYSAPVSVSANTEFTFDQPPPPPSPTTAHVLSTAPFLQGFDFEQDPQDGAFWAHFLQSGIAEEFGFVGGVGVGGAEGGGEGVAMGLMLPMPERMEEDIRVE